MASAAECQEIGRQTGKCLIRVAIWPEASIFPQIRVQTTGQGWRGSGLQDRMTLAVGYGGLLHDSEH